MKIGHLNIRSIFTGFNEFVNLVQENDFCVMMLTETWLSDDVNSQGINIPGYDIIRKDRIGRGGGVAAYIKTKYSYQVIPCDVTVSNNLEYLFFKIKIKSTNLAVGTFYRPPQTNINTFIDDVDNILSYICPTVDEVICVGDFNVNFFNIDNPIISCFQSYNFTQILNEPTRITSRSSTLIDPILVTSNELVNSSGTLSADNISDHRMVFCDLNVKKNKLEPKILKYRCFKNFNLNSFLNDLQGLSWFDIIRENNIENKIILFNDMILSTFDKHAPIKEIRVTKPRAPWMTDGLKISMRERDLALQKFKRTHLDTDWEIYKRWRNSTLSMVRREKRAYLDLLSSKKNSKDTWLALKNLNVRANNSTSIPEMLSDPDKLNEYFGAILQRASNCKNKCKFYEGRSYNNNINFNFTLATPEEIHNILNGLKSNAVGVDGISALMLKYCSPFIDKYLTHIINCCLEESYFPELWRIAIGRPLPKKSNPVSFSDLRLISILPATSKILEKVMYKQIYSYVITNKIIPDTQCGFRKGVSTATALANVTSDILENWDAGMISVLVLLDFSKAFDTINHQLLCTKLKYYGFDDFSIDLLTLYLSGRSQKIQNNNQMSSSISILSGVPQGSILGPLLFLIYTSDIIKSLNYCKIQAYADDIQTYLHFQFDDYLLATDKINSDLQIINQLSLEHNLKLNSSKSFIMLFGNKKHISSLKQILNINIEGVNLPIVNSARNLGVILDSSLRFKEHVTKMLQKTFLSLKLLYSNRHILNFKLKKNLSESLVLSNFNYCDFIYGPCLNVQEKNRIQKIQNSCCRLIFGLRKFDHISHTYQELNWLRMESRRTLHLGNFVINIVNRQDSSTTLKEKLIPRSSIHPRNIRNNNKLTMPHHCTALFQRSFLYNAVKFYNSLKPEYINLEPNKFKVKYKEYLLASNQIEHQI